MPTDEERKTWRTWTTHCPKCENLLGRRLANGTWFIVCVNGDCENYRHIGAEIPNDREPAAPILTEAVPAPFQGPCANCITTGECARLRSCAWQADAWLKGKNVLIEPIWIDPAKEREAHERIRAGQTIEAEFPKALKNPTPNTTLQMGTHGSEFMWYQIRRPNRFATWLAKLCGWRLYWMREADEDAPPRPPPAWPNIHKRFDGAQGPDTERGGKDGGE